MCVSYKALSEMTIENKYSLPCTDDLLDQMLVASVFSSLDLQSAIKSESRMMMCLRLHSGPLWIVPSPECPVWLTNAPATFQAAMNTIFREHIAEFVLVFLDDELVFNKSPEEHARHLRIVLDILWQN